MDKKTKLIIAGVVIGVLLIAAAWMNWKSSKGPDIPDSVFEEAAKASHEPEQKPNP